VTTLPPARTAQALQTKVPTVSFDDLPHVAPPRAWFDRLIIRLRPNHLILASIGLSLAAIGAVLSPFSGRDTSNVALAAALAEVVPGEAQGSSEAPRSPLFAQAGNGPEGQLIQAYVALASGEGRQAMALTQQLILDHPGFTLAQLLYGDLLAAKAGQPQVFGHGTATAEQIQARPDTKDLYEQAMRRLRNLQERPPAGTLPREWVDLPAHVKHAVAVDTERSRLYLFKNGPDGLTLERDFYVSLGKQGIGKQVEGDARTPLGVYWITNALPSYMLDVRFGSAAMGINYPNALDKHLGRTGTGLFLHGVPPNVYSHSLWATDGCVALANEDVQLLLKRLDIDDTPVVIAKQLQWVPVAQTRQAAAEFRPAYTAWNEARLAGDQADLQRWYEGDAKVPAHTAQYNAVRGSVSMVAWYGESTPVMVVTATEPARSAGEAARVFRQYWVFDQGNWRIRFDGPVVNTSTVGRSAANGSNRPALHSAAGGYAGNQLALR
jgi:lipoprotein-anchoring transpeptidase ErfK/SrfK